MDDFEKTWKEANIKADKISQSFNSVADKSIRYVRSHWVDYLLFFFICFCLGAFDVFVLKKSDKFLSGEYWYHAFTRICAYTLANILGIRIMYPRAKNAHAELKKQLEINSKLKDQRGTDFAQFIVNLNLKLKSAAWVNKIDKKIARLEKGARIADIQLFNSQKADDRAEKIKNTFCKKKKELLYLKSDEYINEHIEYLNVKYYRVYEHDFDYSDGGNEADYLHYKTRTSITQSSVRSVGQVIISCVIVTLIMGSLTLSFDETLAVSRAVRIFTIIVNSLMDVGVTLWRLINGMGEGEKLVETEDLRAVIDKNNILTDYIAWKNVKEENKPKNEIISESVSTLTPKVE